jgi:hypothetical protein
MSARGLQQIFIFEVMSYVESHQHVCIKNYFNLHTKHPGIVRTHKKLRDVSEIEKFRQLVENTKNSIIYRCCN